MVYNAFREYKINAEAQQLGIWGLRRSGQFCTAPLEGKIVEVSEDKFPWAAKYPQIGGHRYLESWLKDRMQHIIDGVPKVPDWEEVLQNHERQDSQQITEVAEDIKDDKEVHEQFIKRKLGEIRMEVGASDLAVDHELQVCGHTVRVPVLRLQVDDIAGLLSEEMLGN